MTDERKPLATWKEFAEQANIELGILRDQNATLRAALAVRQAAIDVLCGLYIGDTGWHDAWAAIRALATKEPQS